MHLIRITFIISIFSLKNTQYSSENLPIKLESCSPIRIKAQRCGSVVSEICKLISWTYPGILTKSKVERLIFSINQKLQQKYRKRKTLGKVNYMHNTFILSFYSILVRQMNELPVINFINTNLKMFNPKTGRDGESSIRVLRTLWSWYVKETRVYL